jgi:hypothetical protein
MPVVVSPIKVVATGFPTPARHCLRLFGMGVFGESKRAIEPTGSGDRGSDYCPMFGAGAGAKGLFLYQNEGANRGVSDHEDFFTFLLAFWHFPAPSFTSDSESNLDIGSALQGLFTISVGSLLGIRIPYQHPR